MDYYVKGYLIIFGTVLMICLALMVIGYAIFKQHKKIQELSMQQFLSGFDPVFAAQSKRFLGRVRQLQSLGLTSYRMDTADKLKSPTAETETGYELPMKDNFYRVPNNTIFRCTEQEWEFILAKVNRIKAN